MPSGITPFLNMALPTIGGDRSLWGSELNNDLLTIDAAIASLFALSHRLYVDAGYIGQAQNGSAARPFSTITQALSQVILNNDNAATPYVIDVAPGTYVETIDLGNPAFVQLMFEGHGTGAAIGAEGSVGGVMGAVIAPASGNALQASGALNSIVALQFSGLTFGGPVSLVNATASGLFASKSLVFSDCAFGNNTSLIFGNVGAIGFLRCSIGNTSLVSITNVRAVTWLNSDMNGGQFNLITDNTAPEPLGFTNTAMDVLGWAFDVQIINITGGSFMLVDNAAHFGGSGGALTVGGAGSSLTVNPGANINCNITVQTGGTLTLNGATLLGALTLQSGTTYLAQGNFYVNKITLGALQLGISVGAGAPGFSAPVGSLYLRTDGGASSTLYVVETSVGNWVAK